MRNLLVFLLLVALFPPASAFAAEGVLEINQTCAVETGCFPGDAAGYPVEITSSGSYRLTSDLTGIAANIDGILLSSARITIDLNGFSLVGFALGSGTGNGITGSGTNGSVAGFATIENGAIRGFRALGIALAGATGVRLDRVTLDFNAGGGVHLGDEAQVVGSRFSDNGGVDVLRAGVRAGDSALIRDNVVNGSGGSGIVVGLASTASDNTASANGSVGILAGSGSTVSNNATSGNGADGINGDDGVTIIANASFDNGDATIPAFDDGIQCGAGCLVRENTTRDNTGQGINFISSGSAYSDNVISGNTAGTVLGGTNAGGNVCNGSLTCP